MKDHSPAEMMKLLLRGEDVSLQLLAMDTFSNKFYSNYVNELDVLIASGSKEVLKLLIIHAFSKPHAENWNRQIVQLFRRIRNTAELQSLYILMPEHIFSHEHSIHFPSDVLKDLVGQKSPELDNLMIEHIFTKPHSTYFKAHLIIIAQRALFDSLDFIQRSIMGSPYTKTWKDVQEAIDDCWY